MSVDIWDDMYDFDDEEMSDEDWDILFEEGELFEIEMKDFITHFVEKHEYSKLGTLEYPFEVESILDSDIILN